MNENKTLGNNLNLYLKDLERHIQVYFVKCIIEQFVGRGLTLIIVSAPFFQCFLKSSCTDDVYSCNQLYESQKHGPN